MHGREWLPAAMALVALGPLAGCGESDDFVAEEGPTSEAESTVLAENSLSANGISLNGISLNGISLNALNAASLSSAALAAIKDPGPLGDLARKFMRYAASCALSPSQTFSFQYTDAYGAAHNEAYPGELSLAPGWGTGPLDVLGQRMVSGCLAARVNYYGVPVMISVRSLIEPLKTLVSSQELVDYPDVEGAFWGNLFAPSPYLYACYNEKTIANSRANQRDCAAGHLSGSSTLECGPIHIVGACKSVCQKLNGAGQYYPSCVERPGVSTVTTKTIITTALP